MNWEWKKKNFWIWRTQRRNQQAGVNYCFLDFDGVINLVYDEGSEKYQKLVKNVERGILSDEEAVQRLSAFCLANALHIVISSSWRYGGLERCQTYLYESGMSRDVPIVGLTGYSFHTSREQLIYEYLQTHQNFRKIVVIDDMEMENLKPYLVTTNMYTGFDGAAEERAMHVLRAQKI